jgi:hypothetical protein
MPPITNQNGLVSIHGLEETAIRIRPELMLLPLVYTGDEFQRMGVDLIPGVQYKLRQYNYVRRGGLMQPYYPGMVADESAIGRMEQNELETFLCAGIHNDNIQNYRQNTVGPMTLLGTNKTYRHPLERLVLMSVMKTWAEDLGDAFFFARRNPDGLNKYDCFDGIYTHILKYLADGKITTSRGNLINTGPVLPLTDTDPTPFYQIQNFLNAAHPALIRGGAILNVSSQVAFWYQRAAANAFKETLKWDEFGTLPAIGFKNVRIYPNPNMGEGDLLILSKAKILQLGFDSLSDDEYVRVRNIHDDANIVTFNIQARYGSNIRSIDPKVFAINDGALNPIPWAGDMGSDQTFNIELLQTTGGTIAINPVKDSYSFDDTVTLTATPATGYSFVAWNSGITSNPMTLKVRGNAKFAATFQN